MTILEMKTLRHRESKHFIQGHTASEGKSRSRAHSLNFTVLSYLLLENRAVVEENHIQ